MSLKRFRNYVIDLFTHDFKWHFRFLCIEYIFVRSVQNMRLCFVYFSHHLRSFSALNSAVNINRLR